VTRFTFDNPPGRVVFGAGSLAALPEEIARLGLKRALLISTPGRNTWLDSVGASLGQSFAGKFDRAMPHVPQDIADQAKSAAQSTRAECLIALGGGSAIGVAKAVALELELPIVAVPTTYSGSEMTPIYGITRNGSKETGRSSQVRPILVVYDPDLTLDLPARVTACSGLNAMAHCVEALYAVDANPLSSGAAMQAIMLLSMALPELARDPVNPVERSDALEGAWFAGFALGTVQMALHHKLCHTLGGAFDLPHADTHAVLLPYTAAFNRPAAKAEMRAVADMLDADDAPSALLRLATDIGAPLSLSSLGFDERDIDKAARLAVERQYPNPRPVTEEGIRDLLAAAFHGDSGYVAAG
jgi:maleylacetate reductase